MDASQPAGWYPVRGHEHLVDLLQWWDGSAWDIRLGNVVNDEERDARKAELVLLHSEIDAAKEVLKHLEEAAAAVPTDNLPAALGFGDYKTIADNSESIMNDIKSLRAKAKALIRGRSAVSQRSVWLTSNDGALVDMPKKFAASIGPLLLSILNMQVEIEATRKTGNFRDAQMRLNKTWYKLNDIGWEFGTNLDAGYLHLRTDELELLEVHRNSVLREKEEERERRAQLREEAQAQRELEAEREKLQKELDHYYNVMVALEAQGDTTGIARVEEQILALEEELKEIDFRAANIRAGYVYVISNIGTFGPDIVKIGLTRRLDPLDRIRELSSASVPYRYDVHALFFSADAVSIETILHNHFDARRVNRVNRRKEFFRVRPDEVLAALREHEVELIDWIDEAEAEEYRVGLTLNTGT
ncbi:GIY-YIG nuclease family protein [Pseudarthrobacter sp. MDT3-26]|uniref:GIY-YIG nuclease family protein n=1 Tax=Pseudarthrobacter raffinosi TaxID=2953651 RepID=UPI00208FC267|nr:GIY-YIG nuclease family protein [Pseudarthrobacter sp. MDT3-26]MCO4263729.1 GIY-YIG nuclease family protein [Pseudarthrobacter sp. MDT3-26]